jgi:uncharacterized protein YPO0396
VVIDEAFGRGSDESARYGLELYQRLGWTGFTLRSESPQL